MLLDSLRSDKVVYVRFNVSQVLGEVGENLIENTILKLWSIFKEGSKFAVAGTYYT